MNVAYAFNKLITEIYTDEEMQGRAIPQGVVAAIVIAAAMTECVEYVVNSMKEEFVSHNEGPWS